MFEPSEAQKSSFLKIKVQQKEANLLLIYCLFTPLNCTCMEKDQSRMLVKDTFFFVVFLLVLGKRLRSEK